VVAGPAPPPDPLDSDGRHGPELTPGEELFERYLSALEPQGFDYQFTEDGQLRQYWCPFCEEATVAFRCEHCGKYFTANEIEDQVEKPPVRIPRDVAEALGKAFHEVLYGADVRDALNLKSGRARKTYRRHYLQQWAAKLVAEKISSGNLKTPACDDVAAELRDRAREIGTPNLDGRTVARWYDNFYDRDNQPIPRCRD
jgi:hypothetical protein